MYDLDYPNICHCFTSQTTAVGVSIPRPSTEQSIEMDTMISLSSHESSTRGPHTNRHENLPFEETKSVSSRESINHWQLSRN